MTAAREQRNRYKGSPARPWVRLRFRALDGTIHALKLVADTGNPLPVIVGAEAMSLLQRGPGCRVDSNFGVLIGGWLQLAMSELSLAQDLMGYAGESVRQAVQADHAEFQGLVGLPLLRQLEYGGNADAFWIRPAGSPTRKRRSSSK